MKRTIALLFVVLFLISSVSYAKTWELPFNGNALFANSNEGHITVQDLTDKVDTGLTSGLTAILVLLKNLGLVICVCVLAFMGVQFIIAPADKKAELKASFTPYLIGLLLLIAGVPIAITIINILIKVI